MKICILSKQRAGKVTTLSLFDNKDCILFVEPQELETYKTSYPDVEVVSIQQNDNGVVYARNFIMDYMKGKFIMSDDDISKFFIRNEELKSKYEPYVPDQKLFDSIEKNLDMYSVVVVPKANYARLIPGTMKENTLLRHFFAINKDTLPFFVKFNSEMKLLEDLDFVMQLLKYKIKYGADYGFCLDAKYISPGGNESNYDGNHLDRNLEMLEQLKQKYGPEYLRIRTRKSDGRVIGFGPNYKRFRQ